MDAEVERVARLMHDAFNAHCVGRTEWPTTVNSDFGPWEALRPNARDTYLALARAVVADRRELFPIVVQA